VEAGSQRPDPAPRVDPLLLALSLPTLVTGLAVADVTTTVLTLTLTGLAADSWLAGGTSPRVGGGVAAVGLMAPGALLLRVDVALPVLAAAMVIALAAVELRLGSQERSDLRLMRMCQRIGRMVRVPSRAPWPPGGA
jgi:hypothetical protein